MRPSELIAAILFVTIFAIPYVLEGFFIFSFTLGRTKSVRPANILKTKPAVITHIFAVIGLICLIYAFFIEPNWIEVKIVPIETEKLSTATIRVVQISDLHCEPEFRNEKKLVEIINSLKPDVIVFTGDSRNSNAGLPVFKETMENLHASIGKFAVLGNVDVHLSYGIDLFEGTGFQELDKNTVMLEKDGDKFYISGLSCQYPRDFRNLLADIPNDCFSIFLYHYSDLVEKLDNLNVDLYLSGHTHGGQVALPFYGSIITLSKFGKKYESGLYHVGRTTMYVNRGIGLESNPAPKVRFFARPEITVFDIKPKKQKQ